MNVLQMLFGFLLGLGEISATFSNDVLNNLLANTNQAFTKSKLIDIIQDAVDAGGHEISQGGVATDIVVDGQLKTDLIKLQAALNALPNAIEILTFGRTGEPSIDDNPKTMNILADGNDFLAKFLPAVNTNPQASNTPQQDVLVGLDALSLAVAKKLRSLVCNPNNLGIKPVSESGRVRIGALEVPSQKVTYGFFDSIYFNMTFVLKSDDGTINRISVNSNFAKELLGDHKEGSLAHVLGADEVDALFTMIDGLLIHAASDVQATKDKAFIASKIVLTASKDSAYYMMADFDVVVGKGAAKNVAGATVTKYASKKAEHVNAASKVEGADVFEKFGEMYVNMLHQEDGRSFTALHRLMIPQAQAHIEFEEAIKANAALRADAAKVLAEQEAARVALELENAQKDATAAREAAAKEQEASLVATTFGSLFSLFDNITDTQRMEMINANLEIKKEA